MTGSPTLVNGDVLFHVEGSLGIITLNRPKALNALSAAMIEAIADALDAWAPDDNVNVVMIRGAGERGLCAGGDIRALYQQLVAGRTDEAVTFMAVEYCLNACIAAYPKPYVAIMDGIVMGGGVGVSAHGSTRLVTERSAIAMPEVSIGMFPDVGGTFLLGHAPGELGTHAALTGRRFGSADAMLLGLADHAVPSTALPKIVAALADCAAASSVEPLLATFHVEPESGVLCRQRDWIDECYQFETVEEIVAALEAHREAEAHVAAAEIRGHSPTALKVTLRALRQARRSSDLHACLEREYLMVQTVLCGQEIVEGIRAAVIDKDGTPTWRPARLEDVGPAVTESYFASKGPSLGLAG